MSPNRGKEVTTQMMNRSFLTLAALVLLPIAGQAQSSMIHGKARTNDGATLTNALVELRQATGGVISQLTTGNDGDFEFTGLRAGEYEIRVTLSGYEPATEIVRLRENLRVISSSAAISEVVNIEIRLRPSAEASLGQPGTSFVQDVPKAARAAYVKGISKIREGKSDEGIAFLREATLKYGDYYDAHFALGAEYYRLGKDTDALESLERARLINDRGAGVYYVFGMVMARQQKFRLAEYAFAKAAELNVNHAAAHFNHAVALIELAVRTTDSSQVKITLGQADRELDRAWELSGKRLNTVFLQRARVREELGDNEGAARERESYLKAEPDAKDAAAQKALIEKLRQKK
jgi:tetratricopeptide (TPR) repeat protein